MAEVEVAEATVEPAAAAPMEEEAAKAAPEEEVAEEAAAGEDDAGSEGEAAKGQYEGDQTVEGKRARKSTEKLEYDHEKKKKVVVGSGTPLGDFEAVDENMRNPKFKDTLEQLHMIVYKSKGAKGKQRKNLVSFRGLVYENADVERQRYLDRLYKLKQPQITALLDLLKVDRSAKSFGETKIDKDALCERLLAFLEAPSSDLQTGRATKAPGQKRAAPKKKAAAKKKVRGW